MFGISNIGKLGKMGFITYLSQNFPSGSYVVFITLLRIKPGSEISLKDYQIQIIVDDKVIHSGKTSNEGTISFKNKNEITEYTVKIQKDINGKHYESTFLIKREEKGDKLEFYVDDYGEVFEKYVKVEKPILFLFNDDVAVDYNDVYSNTYWVCYVNENNLKKERLKNKE